MSLTVSFALGSLEPQFCPLCRADGINERRPGDHPGLTCVFSLYWITLSANKAGLGSSRVATSFCERNDASVSWIDVLQCLALSALEIPVP